MLRTAALISALFAVSNAFIRTENFWDLDQDSGATPQPGGA